MTSVPDQPDDSRPSPAVAPQPSPRDAPSAADLPYGPLPARPDDRTPAPPASSSPEPAHETPAARPQPPEAASQAADESEQADETDEIDETDESNDEISAELEIATGRSDADDDVHFGIAAKALGVSRKTVERMVKRGQLDRGPSGAQATVSKRALVALLEQRRRDITHVADTAEVHGEHAGAEQWRTAWPQDAASEVQELLRPVLEPLLDEFVAARTRAAVLESQLEGVKAHAARERIRDELLVALATGGWRQRRKARRAALRHYVLGEEDPAQDPD